MDISAQKIQLIDWLIHLQNQQTINLLEKIREQNNQVSKKKLSDVLLKLPTISEEEVATIEENRKWMNQWR